MTGFVFDGKQKVTLTLAGIALIGGAMIATHAFLAQHAARYFVSTAAAQTAQAQQALQIKEIADIAREAAQAAKQTADTLATHVRGQELKEARQRLDMLRKDLFDAQISESTHGPNDLTRARKRELEPAIERQRSYVDCLEAGRPNCQP